MKPRRTREQWYELIHYIRKKQEWRRTVYDIRLMRYRTNGVPADTDALRAAERIFKRYQRLFMHCQERMAEEIDWVNGWP